MLEEGLKLEMEKVVEKKELASEVSSGILDVFSTPAMITLMENTSQNTVQPYLDEGKSTVGIEVDIKHLKATPLGMKVRCEAVLKKIDGNKLQFNVTVWDEDAKIGEGEHTRYIVDSKEFMERLS